MITEGDQIETSTSPFWANLGHLTVFCARGVGNLTGKAFPGVGNLTFAWVAWGKLNRTCPVSDGFFSGTKVLNHGGP